MKEAFTQFQVISIVVIKLSDIYSLPGSLKSSNLHTVKPLSVIPTSIHFLWSLYAPHINNVQLHQMHHPWDGSFTVSIVQNSQS